MARMAAGLQCSNSWMWRNAKSWKVQTQVKRSVSMDGEAFPWSRPSSNTGHKLEQDTNFFFCKSEAPTALRPRPVRTMAVEAPRTSRLQRARQIQIHLSTSIAPGMTSEKDHRIRGQMPQCAKVEASFGPFPDWRGKLHGLDG